MRASDVMNRPVYTVHDTDTVEQAAAVLGEHQITAAPVVDNAGTLVGMVSEGDLLLGRVPRDIAARAMDAAEDESVPHPGVVAEVMSQRPVCTYPQADLADVAKIMVQDNVRSVPVLEADTIVGIISRRDIVRSVIRTDEVLAQEVQHRLDEYGGGERRWQVAVTHGVVTVAGDFDNVMERTIVGVMARTVPGVAAVHLTEPAP